MLDTLEHQIDHWFAQPTIAGNPDAEAAFHELRDGLESGLYRAAEPDPTATNRLARQPLGQARHPPRLPSRSPRNRRLHRRALLRRKAHFPHPPLHPRAEHPHRHRRHRRPRGSLSRRRRHRRPRPPYINVGAHVGENTLIDSHALVGSCAQIGARVHLSAAAQIGGVLEPVNASPVIIEDDCLIGGNTGVYEGTVVRRRAVLAAGVILTRGTPVYDLTNGNIYRATPETSLIIPENAVVVPGSRAITHGPGKNWGLSVATPVIVKYRDEKTELSLALEDLLR